MEVGRKDLPSGPGCYVVYQDDMVVYVGSSTNLKHRCLVYRAKRQFLPFANHDQRDRGATYGTPWGSVPVHAIRVKVKRSRRIGDWLMWEWRLINRLSPQYNLAGKRA